MAGFGSLHAGMLLREKTQGETPAANKQDNRASMGVLQSIAPEHLLHPETRASGVRSGPEFETPEIEEQQALDPPVQRAPFDRGFGQRIAKKTTAANGSTAAAPPAPGAPAAVPDAVAPHAVAPHAVAPDAVAPDAVAPDAVAPDAVAPAPAPTPAIDERAAAVEALFKPSAVGAEEPASPADAAPSKPAPAAEKTKASAWRRRMFGGGQPEPAAPAVSADALPPADAAPEPPADTPLGDTIAEAPRPLPRVPPAEVSPATVKPRSAVKMRKKMTVRIELPNFNRLLAAGAALKLTRQDILARALDRYLDHLGIAPPEADGEQ